MYSRKVSLVYSSDLSAEDFAVLDEYQNRLLERQLPIIFSVEHLSMLVGLKVHALYGMSNNPGKFYRVFYTRSNSGKSRKISAPLPSLLRLQRYVLDHILYKISVSDCCKSYVSGKSIKDNARFHRKQECVVKFDVEKFFDSIKERFVFELFFDMGYSFNLSVFLSKICCLNGCLPQGAPTSGYLSNLLLKEFDAVVFEWCRKYKYRYTRYADDITISGSIDNPILCKEKVSRELSRLGLSLNKSKTRYLRAHNKQVITGLVVNEKVSPGRAYLKKIRSDCYYIKKFGVFGHLNRIKGGDPLSYLDGLIGRISYANFVVGGSNELDCYKNYIISCRNEISGLNF